MNLALHHQIAMAQIADRQRRAGRAAIARAARRGTRTRVAQRFHPAAGLAPRVIAASSQHARPDQARACC